MGGEKPGDALLERLKIAARCKNYKELSSALGVSVADLKQSRKKGTLHPKLRERMIRCGISPAWVEHEQGRPHFEGYGEPEGAFRGPPQEDVLGTALEDVLRDLYKIDPRALNKTLH